MDDKKAFKILASVSIILCMCIILFNAWVAPSIVPTYKEYRKIFNISDDNDFEEEYIKGSYELEDDDENDDDDDDDDEVQIVNINDADLDELMTLPNVGETLAKRIIDYREKYGSFKTEEDLLNVEGLGEKKLEAIIEFIEVE